MTCVCYVYPPVCVNVTKWVSHSFYELPVFGVARIKKKLAL